jgi:membrane protein
MTAERTPSSGLVARVRERVDVVQGLLQRTLFWRVWERMLEIEFVDRSVALAGKAFVSFFPLVITVAAFLPDRSRTAIFSTLTHRLGISGEALVSAKSAFASADDIRRATGLLGLLFTFFFASSFTTALQRVYLRSWRRPAGGKAGEYLRGPVWFVTVLVYMAAMGGVRSLSDGSAYIVFFSLVALAGASLLWWFTSWFMLMGQVRWRVLLPSGVITGVTMGVYTLSANVWMSQVVTRNENQYGFFGVALALVTWFSGASICMLIGACGGAVFAADPGWVGQFIRGSEDSLLVEGAEPSLPAPVTGTRLRDAFRAAEDDVGGPDPD